MDSVAKEVGLSAKDLVLTEIFTKKIYKVFDEKDSVKDIGQNDVLTVYELDDAPAFLACPEHRWHGTSSLGSDSGAGQCGVVITHRQMARATAMYSDLLGLPLLTCMSKRIRPGDVLDIVKREVEARIGAIAENEWKLFYTTDRQSAGTTTNLVERGGPSLEWDSRVYLVLEWLPAAEAPQRLDRLFDEVKPSGASRSGSGNRSVDLEHCFALLETPNVLSSQDSWYCNKCKEHREATFKSELWTLPPVLIIQLKRFAYTTYCRDRLDTEVSFPLDGLDLTSYCRSKDGGRQVYDLVSISKHMGGLGGGHYVAYSRSCENGHWYLFNDSSVSKVTEEEVRNQQVGVYVLFYLRREVRPVAWGPPPA